MNELQKQLVAAYLEWAEGKKYISQQVMARDYGVTLTFLRMMLKEVNILTQNKMNITLQIYLINLWSFWNENYLGFQTVSEMAAYYGISSECMAIMLSEGNRLTNIENGLEN